MGYWMQRAKHLRDAGSNVPKSSANAADPQAQGPLGIHPGDLVRWEINGHRGGPAVVDVVHMDEDGSMWIFVTLVSGWAAVNAKYVTKVRTF